MEPGWLARARAAAARPPLSPRTALCLDADAGPVEIGSVDRSVVTRLAAAALPIRRARGRLLIEAPFDTSLGRLARWLAAKGLGGRWRDEQLPVVDRTGRTWSTVERGAVRALGLATFAVHLSVRAVDGRWWVQQRALDKATDPGLWDTTMGGQMAAGETMRSTLARETLEEAGLGLDRLRDLGAAADVEVRRPVPEGYVNERIAVFRATLEAGAVPVNRDGEVLRFECLARPALRRRLAAGGFTLEASLILGAELEGEA